MKFRFSGIFMVLLFNIICYTLLYFYPDAPGKEKLLFGMAVVCAVILASYILIYALNLGDAYPFLIVSMLASISIIILYSLGIQQLATGIIPENEIPMIEIAQRQIMWFLVSVVVFFAGYFIYRFLKIWDKLFWGYVGLAAVLFIITLLFANDNVEKGVKNWITIGGISIQPSEFIKLSFCFAMAYLFSQKRKIEGIRARLYVVTKEDWLATAIVYGSMLLFLLQGELGTAVLFFLMYMALMIAYDVPWVMPVGNGLLVVLALFVVFKFCDSIGPLSRAMERFEIWMDPEVYNYGEELGKPYGTEHMYNSLRAICSGGFFGVGLGRSGIYYLAAIESDLVFSAICYEMGIFMGFAVIMMYFILAYRGYKIAMEVNGSFNRALAITIVTSIAIQAFIIIAGVTKLIPLTGITLPFVSAGGSSMVISFAMIGILTAISHNKEKSAFSS